MKKNDFLKYDVENFKISQDVWIEKYTAKTESMMALGNGYLGLRSADEERALFNKEDLFVNGIFNKENKNEVPELANLADLTKTDIWIDGVLVKVYLAQKYLKELSLKTGSLVRKIEIEVNNKNFEIIFERFVSQHNRHIYCQRININQLSGKESEVIIIPMIDGTTTNHGAQHLMEGIKNKTSETSIRYTEKTTDSKREIVHNMNIIAISGEQEIDINIENCVVVMARRQVGLRITSMLDQDKPFVLEKMMSVNTSIDSSKKEYDSQQVQFQADKLLQYLSNITYDLEFSKSNKSWKRIWNQFFLEIKGDSYDAQYDSLANIFGIFHINSFVPKNNSNLSIGAKGLSGEGYQGHSYWDTEFFINPNYLFTNPQVVRNLLEYRYKGIQGARDKAQEIKERNEESNLEGAQFPWEMAWPTDGEVCPYWGQADIVTGKQVPIASRRQEIHVSADIAWAVHQYYSFTDDQQFMNDMGYEMIIDTAIFYANRAEKIEGRYEIRDVMGPNEYKGNINNNAYINMFARINLELAIKYINKLNETQEGKKTLENIYKKIPYPIPYEKMLEVSQKLKQQLPNENNIIAENDSFFKLKRNDISEFKLLGDAGKKLFSSSEGIPILSGQLVKQADVVLLTYLLPHLFSKEVIESNFDFYEPITTHDSSLSPTTYAIQAIDLRKMDLAYQLYKYSLNIDMGPNMKSCDAGIHAGSLAAIWQTTIFGYGGLRWIDGQIHINPILPTNWDSLKYRFQFQNVWLEVYIQKEKFSIEIIEGNAIEIFVQNKKIKIIDKKEFCN